jgi:pimeloyl-ACP methyl ester carboxylesterase
VPRSRVKVVVLVGAMALAACDVTGSSSSISVVGTRPPGTAGSGATTTTGAGPASPSTAATGATGPTGTTGAATTVPPPPTWSGCGTHLDCVQLHVPLDYTKPSGPQISLFVQRHKAAKPSQRIGALLVNPGGPGVSATFLTAQAELVFSPQILNRFDIVSWDPRGVGQSTRVDCVDNLDPYMTPDPTPDSDTAKAALEAASKQLADACRQRSGTDLLAHVSTQETARDIDEIRKFLGEDKISWLGFSYGSELGATFATMFPGSLRAAVLDGAIDPNLGPTAIALSELKGIRATLNRILDQCSATATCPFRGNGDTRSRFDALVKKLDHSPLPAPAGTNRPAIGEGILSWAVVQALYVEDFWPVLDKALAAADKGDAQGLLDLYDQYVRRNPDGTFNNEIEAYLAISCIDGDTPNDRTSFMALLDALRVADPQIGEWSWWPNPCLYWPVPPVKRIALTGKGAGTILVVAATGDPITPIDQSRSLAKELEHGTLLVRTGEGHTSYGAGNQCIDSAVDDYLINLKVPPDGTVCK